MKASRYLVLALVCAVVFCGTLVAQDATRSTLNVRVEDPTGAVVPGATVKIMSRVQPELEATTGARGEVVFRRLIPADDYQVSASSTGFKTAVAENISLRLGETRPVTLTLEPGAVVETVEVVGGAGVVDLGTTETGGSVDDQIYANTPLRRGIASAFTLSPGVGDSGGTGAVNPSIGGASGFENLYLIDGVNVTDGGFGSFGTYSGVFGALGQGTTTSFIKEVEVKTGGYDAKYGQALGGIVNIVTKSGGNDFHGAVFGFWGPNKLETARKQANDFRIQEFQNEEQLGTAEYDFGFEFEGRILRDHLFFFGSLNPTVTRTLSQAPGGNDPTSAAFDVFTFGGGDCDDPPLGAGCFNLGAKDIVQRSINYAAKLTGQINPSHRVEASIFGDPTIRSFGPLRRFTGTLDPLTLEPADWSRIDVSNLSLQVRYNGIVTPNWIVSGSFMNNHQRFEEQQLLNLYSIDDRTGPVPIDLGGVGFFQNTTSDVKGIAAENTNIIDAGILGQHQLTEGFTFETNNFKAFTRRTGPDFPVVTDPLLNQMFAGINSAGQTTFGATFRLQSCLVATTAVGFPSGDCFGEAPAGFVDPVTNDTFVARQTRGQFFGQVSNTISRYTAGYAQDDWIMNRYLTVKLGLRWEQERLIGTTTGKAYTFSNSWGPRIGVILDPFGTRKSKVQFSFARFFQKLPNDLSVRTFEGEAAYLNLEYWTTSDKNIDPSQANYIGVSQCPQAGTATLATGYVCVPIAGPDGILGNADDTTGGPLFPSPTISGNLGGTIFPGTRMTYQDELTIGFDHEVGNSGVLLGARYIDRRLKRIVEDFNYNTMEEASGGFFAIFFPLGNPSATADQFVNGQLIDGTPFVGPDGTLGTADDLAGCFPGTEGVQGPFGANTCFSAASGSLSPDGVIDGLPDPVREYQAVQITFERRLRDNWQFAANYTIARLQGNFEGAFRNDNGQDDPGITSLFDFRDSQAFGDSYSIGKLPNHRSHVVNAYGSYMFNEGPASGLNIGANLRVSSGKPLTELLAHPLFENSGEIACSDDVLDARDIRGQLLYSDETRRIGCISAGRGGFGTTQAFGTVDLRADYTARITERFSLRGGVDLFNVFNATRVTDRRTTKEAVAGEADPDFNTPGGFEGQAGRGFQLPFKARFFVRLEW